MKNIKYISIVLLTFISLNINAQDIHFSQFWNAPLINNPSFAGKSEGNYRVIVNHRSQWGSVTSSPYRTFGANFDMRFNTKSKTNFFAGGISMYSDVAGTSKMRTNLANLAFSYHLKASENHFISAGVQGGINQKSFEAANLRFDNQFDGSGHNAAINSNEAFNNLTQLKPTASAGLSYMWSNTFGKSNRFAQAKKEINVGFAVHHFNSPRFDFIEEDRLGFKYVSSFEGSFNSALSPWTIKPAVYVAIQNKAADLVLGSLFEYAFSQRSQITDFKNSVSIAFGTYYRINDAIIPTIQVQWASFDVAFSYDVNLSQLTAASKGQGGFEIGLKYISQNSLYGRKSRSSFY